MPSGCDGVAVVPDLEVLEDRVGELEAGVPPSRSRSSICMRDQNDSIMELS